MMFDFNFECFISSGLASIFHTLTDLSDDDSKRQEYKVSQCVAVCCSVLQCVALCCSVLQYVAVYCSVLQCGLYHVIVGGC